MITLELLQQTISSLIRAGFINHQIYAGDVTEGLKRPCFFVQIIPVTSDYETTMLDLNQYMVVIDYFGKEGTTLENIRTRDKLKTTIGRIIRVSNRCFTPLGSRSELIDGRLQYRFDLRFYDEPPQDPSTELVETMEEIKITWGDK